jgi:hypothetical protein
MSGGIAVDESGALGGLICCSLPAGNPEDYAVSHVTTLWPMLRTLISADRDGDYLKGMTYPMIDLALDGLIGVTDLALLSIRDTSWPRIAKGTRFRGYISRLVRQKAVSKSVQEVSKHVAQVTQSLTSKWFMLRLAPGRARTCNPMIRSHNVKRETFKTATKNG